MANNPQNLIPNEQRTPEQRRKNASKAGKASAAAKRKRKAIKECLEMLLAKSVADDAAREMLAAMGIAEKDMQNTMLIAAGLFKKATEGDVQAVKTLMDAIGELGKQETVGNVVINIVDDLK